MTSNTMTEAQFELLKQIFIAGAAEVKNDANLSDWLMNIGGSFISIAVSLETSEDTA
jgi:hypothetical protein